MEDIGSVIGDVKVVAIIGCSKNSGKTTVLNSLISSLKDLHLGILSIGIDGEEVDFWLGVPKPRIYVREGFLVATADKTLKGGSVQVRTLLKTNVHTPLGELVIVKIERPGTILLAGVRHKNDMRMVVNAMLRHHADRVLIDGSYQRIMSADPEIAQGAILATGAILGRTVEEVVEKTQHILDRLLLPRCNDSKDLSLLEETVLTQKAIICNSVQKRTVVASEGLNIDQQELSQFFQQSDAISIYLPAVLTDGLISTILNNQKGKVRIIIVDPTRLFTTSTILSRFLDRGNQILVGKPINLLAVAVNPVSVLGYELPEDILVKEIRHISRGIPVFSFRENMG